MSDNWNTYFTFIDNKPASLLLDLEPWENGDNELLVHLYRLRVTLNEPNENGLTCEKEAEVLYAIEDSIHDSLDSNYMFVGRITTDGRRDFFYYTESVDGSKLESLAEKFLTNYKYGINRIEEQKPRAFYHEFLYPNKSDWHRMANRQLVDKLIELGDNLEKSRTVNHWIYFSSEESRNFFKEKVLKDGFHIEDQVAQDNKYSLRISRNDFVQIHSISDVTDYLINVAQEFDGDYDGWETKVIKEQEGFSNRLKRIFKSKK
ncbi:Regulator of ribonuclease activity B [compost metagenome]